MNNQADEPWELGFVNIVLDDVCVSDTGMMAITHSLLVVSSLPPAPFLPPFSVQMEWISDEC